MHRYTSRRVHACGLVFIERLSTHHVHIYDVYLRALARHTPIHEQIHRQRVYAYICDAYAHVTGKDLTHINYYRGFSSWRMAAIDQGVYKRYAEEATGDVEEMDLEEKKETVLRRATTALEQLTN